MNADTPEPLTAQRCCQAQGAATAEPRLDRRPTINDRPISDTVAIGLGRAETRRAEDAGRSPKRRPEGRGAAGGGGEGRPLGNPRCLLRIDTDRGRS
jgi:hypothetical protein